ncbi:MAG: hypothetical protein NTW73_01650 [Candidatus Parcubacteria bacterium]|nr:hypothetical protein [Candidatus Parcubacteria bacterium]
MSDISKISSWLKLPDGSLEKIQARMDSVYGDKGQLDSLVLENTNLINRSLEYLKIKPDASAEDISLALLNKALDDDRQISEFLGNPDIATVSGGEKVGDLARKLAEPEEGYFLKYEKAKEFLSNQPPLKTMAALGYQNVSDMLAKEDVLELFASLRFLEDGQWLNDVFFKQYENISFNDFEKRKIEIRVLDIKWVKAAEKFVAKKYHNISHLKELGVVFIIPVKLGVPGEILEMLALISHYLNEIAFYNQIFKGFSLNSETFAFNFIQALKGSLLEEKLPDLGKINWLIIQQYLAKKDPSDWRLFEPHLNPEVLHWEKAERAFGNMKNFSQKEGWDFWLNLGWVGDYFKNNQGQEVFVSFNLIDTVMSLVKTKENIKYLYHHQEALWNKVFVSYAGEEKMKDLIAQNWLKGYIEI